MSTDKRSSPPSPPSRHAVPTPFDLVLFGGTGDLAMRKLLPALYRRFADGHLSSRGRIIGVARSSLGRDEYLAKVEATCRQHVGADFDAAACQGFAALLSYVR